MLAITGYAGQWSVRQGDTLRFMIGVAGGGSYRARVARIFCGDPNPAGPGYREVPMPCGIEGEHQGREQPMHPGSWVDVPKLTLGDGPLELQALVWPTLPDGREQVVLSWAGQGGTIELGLGAAGAFCRVTGRGGEVTVQAGPALTERAWHAIGCRIDDGVVEVTQRPLALRLDLREEAAASAVLPPGVSLRGEGAAAIAARRHDRGVDRHFNGKIAQPRLGPAAWDFAIGISGDAVTDTGPQQAQGRCVNLPTRAMTGPGWTGEVQRWTDAPGQYDAIHFHQDDVGDAGWEESLALSVPADWPSGLYALHLECAGGTDNIPFFVRARQPGSQARIAFLAPSFTYTVYSQFQRAGRQAQIAERAAAWGAQRDCPDGHPEYGVSPYNHHVDGSGVVMSSMRRPMIDKRINQFHLMDPAPGASGTYWITADSYILDMLDRAGLACEVITDHDLHAEGAALLRHYDVVITGQHPEYHSYETWDGIAHYLQGGGRFMYLGGNGFYWRVAPHADGPWALELRRAEGGIRLWETLPGESYNAFDGRYGGLWRRLGRPPQSLVGVGFSAQGDYRSGSYTFGPGVMDPRVAFARAGIEAAAQPGAVFGDRGLMAGGAAGHELDRADVRLGTPRHAIILASGIPDDPSFQPVNEERRDHGWPGTREELIRSDIVFFETPGGGAVFSVGSMNFIGALPIDGYENTTAKLVKNVIRRFADPAPFPPLA